MKNKNIIEIEIPEGYELLKVSSFNDIGNSNQQYIVSILKQSTKSCKTCLFENSCKIVFCNKQSNYHNWQSKQDLSNTKIWIGDNPKLSELVQKKAFELDYIWATGSKKVEIKDYTSLYFHNENHRTVIRQDNSKEISFFRNEKFTEITPQDLGIKEEEYTIKLITEDGVKLYKNDECWVYTPNDITRPIYSTTIVDRYCIIEDHKYFSTKQAVEKWLFEKELIKLKEKYNQ